MNPFYQSLAIYTGLMALATAVGGFLPLLRPWNRRYLPLVLTFAAGIMLGSAFTHLIPDAYQVVGKSVGFWVLAGFLFLYVIEKFITVHICETLDCEVHHLGINAFIGIAIHALIQGVALGGGLMVPGLGGIVFLAIVAHKAPEMFSLTTVLLASGNPRSRIVLLSLIILLLIPLGALLAYGLIQPSQTKAIAKAVAFSAGTFIHISLSDLLPEAHRHSSSKVASTLMLLLGVVLMGLVGHDH